MEVWGHCNLLYISQKYLFSVVCSLIENSLVLPISIHPSHQVLELCAIMQWVLITVSSPGHFGGKDWQHWDQRVCGDHYGSPGPQTVSERRMQPTSKHLSLSYIRVSVIFEWIQELTDGFLLLSDSGEGEEDDISGSCQHTGGVRGPDVSSGSQKLAAPWGHSHLYRIRRVRGRSLQHHCPLRSAEIWCQAHDRWGTPFKRHIFFEMMSVSCEGYVDSFSV